MQLPSPINVLANLDIVCVDGTWANQKEMGRNPAPWLKGTIVNVVSKKSSARQKPRA